MPADIMAQHKDTLVIRLAYRQDRKVRVGDRQLEVQQVDHSALKYHVITK